jgi:hypothetical protein
MVSNTGRARKGEQRRESEAVRASSYIKWERQMVGKGEQGRVSNAWLARDGEQASKCKEWLARQGEQGRKGTAGRAGWGTSRESKRGCMRGRE